MATGEKLHLSELVESFGVGEQLSELKEDVTKTTFFREKISTGLGVSLDQKQNGNLANFTLGIIDGFLEFPAIVELYINNSVFREELLITLRQLSIRDFVNSILEIGEDIISGDAYKIGKAGVKIAFLSTGLVGLIRQFGYNIVKKGGSISLVKSGLAATTLGMHTIGYATNSNMYNRLK